LDGIEYISTNPISECDKFRLSSIKTLQYPEFGIPEIEDPGNEAQDLQPSADTTSDCCRMLAGRAGTANNDLATTMACLGTGAARLP
jgi:hypothetical protein